MTTFEEHAMGLEVIAHVELGRERGEAKVHLDAAQLQLSGGVRARIAIKQASGWRVEAGCLIGNWQGVKLAIELGEAAAQKWLDKILNPPSLAQKLGVHSGKTLHWQVESIVLRDFFAQLGVDHSPIIKADLCFAEVSEPAHLVSLLTLALKLKNPQQLWVVRRKGKSAKVKQAQIMTALAQLGFKPSKTAAWNDDYGADRYSL
jgi:hypothetical protein